jgi:8-oxo-dGTP diphosphatase
MSVGTAKAPKPLIDLAPLTPVYTERSSTGRHESRPSEPHRREPRVIVGAAIIAEGRVLACARANPPELAGMWEFPGGKVEPGESEVAALVRECDEELAVRVEIGARIGPDVRLGHAGLVLKIYTARLLGDDEPQPLEHSELRWLGADELTSVPWLPADTPIVAALRPILAT